MRRGGATALALAAALSCFSKPALAGAAPYYEPNATRLGAELQEQVPTNVGVLVSAATDRATGLAHDAEGTGVPVVFLHGLTFDRRSWRPLLGRLDDPMRSITVDLPAHGQIQSVNHCTAVAK